MRTLKNTNFYLGLICLIFTVIAVDLYIDYRMYIRSLFLVIPAFSFVFVFICWGHKDLDEQSVFEDMWFDFRKFMEGR